MNIRGWPGFLSHFYQLALIIGLDWHMFEGMRVAVSEQADQSGLEITKLANNVELIACMSYPFPCNTHILFCLVLDAL